MSSFLILLLIAGCVAAFIWLLHKNQRRRTLDTVERTAPLPAIGDDSMPCFDEGSTAQPSKPVSISPDSSPPSELNAVAFTGSAGPDGTAPDTWLGRVKSLREAGDATRALGLCRTHFPRSQALQQAAIILRQQIRDCTESGQPADALLTDLFRTAVLADLFRNGSPQKPADPAAALAAVQQFEFAYADIGHGELKLLNKSDVRTLEQAWGSPLAHRHGEEVLGAAWQSLCRQVNARA